MSDDFSFENVNIVVSFVVILFPDVIRNIYIQNLIIVQSYFW